MIQITSKRDGFMRGGVRHPAAPTQYDDDHFSEEQLAAIMAEPVLVVENIEDDGSYPAPAEMTVAQLKKLLETLEISYPASAKKADLVALVEKNTAPPREE